MKSYHQMMTLNSFEDRFEYLKCHSTVGEDRFGPLRFVNQEFYHSKEWKKARMDAIIRDKGCDLGMPGMEIKGPIYVHHINEISMEMFEHSDDALLDLDNLICCSKETHNAIHFGDISQIPSINFVTRKPNDTIPWR